MSLRLRLALSFAAVALATAAVVAVAAPYVVGRGFVRLESALGMQAGPAATAPGGRAGAGPPAGRGPTQAGEIQQETIVTLLSVALGAAAAASLAGVAVAGRLVTPLRRLERTAAAVAAGQLGRRSGISGRRDEIGSLGRSFDRMAEDLQRAEETRRRMLQDAAHELRTPLAVIDATASALLDGVYEPDSHHLETIREQTRLLARVVDDLRTISLAEGGRLALELEQVEVTELLAAAADSFEVRAGSVDVAIAVEPAAPLWVIADPGRLRQALGALLDNALRHTPPGGRIELSARPVAAPGHGQRPTTGTLEAGRGPRAVAHIEVRDSGPGLAASDLERVFDRFYQADQSRDRGRGGSGLGLPIVRALAEAHGGRVGALNRKEGGACFWIELPLQDVSNAGRSPSSV